jgi:cyanophycin synthetase
MAKILESTMRPVRLLWRNSVLAPLRRRRFEKIPIVMVTGTAGKTSTCRLAASILRAAGHSVGLACTDGAYLNGQIFSEKEHSGYGGARRVLTHPQVTAVVLETARGGILKWGLYVDRSDVAAITNVSYDHIGIDGVETVEQMALVKSRVTDTARKAVVINADDPNLSKIIDRYPPQKLILVSANADEPRVRDIVEKGGSCVVLDQDGFIVLEGSRIIHVAEIPLTLGGAALHQAYNAMTATALATGLNIDREAICSGLRNCTGGAEHNPARTSIMGGLSRFVQVEMGDNPLSLSANLQTMHNLHPEGHKVVMVAIPGNRNTEHLEKIAELLAKNFDNFICYELSEFRRGRRLGEVPALIEQYLVKFGAKPSSVMLAPDLDDALAKLVMVLESANAAMIICPTQWVEKKVRQSLLPEFGNPAATH